MRSERRPNLALQSTKTRRIMCRKLFVQLGRVVAPELCTLGRTRTSSTCRKFVEEKQRQ